MLAQLMIALALASPPPPSPLGESPGGYYEIGEVREREPNDGELNALIGSILLPLGVLRGGAGAAMIVTASPASCQARYGAGASDKTCSGLRLYGWVGVGYGGLMAATGAVFLAMGLVQRSRHRTWKIRNGVSVAPLLRPDGGGIGLSLRF